MTVIVRAVVMVCAVIGAMGVRAGAEEDARAPIDREALVRRHNVVLREVDPNGSMAVGNGEFAFNFDVTGLQSLPEFYEKTMPVGILSNWGWHSFPNPEGYTLEKFKFTTIKREHPHPGPLPEGEGEKVREFSYPASSTSRPGPDAAYLRGNPHRFGLGQIGLSMTKADGSKVAIGDLQKIEEKLDLWTGIATSSFEVEGVPVHVETAVHSKGDEVGVRIESPLIASGRLKVRIAFPYASSAFGPEYQDCARPEAHETKVVLRHPRPGPLPKGEGEVEGADFERTLDAMRYNVRMKWSAGGKLTEAGKHEYRLSGTVERIELTAWFAPRAIDGECDSVAEVQAASRDGWEKYWKKSGAIDLSGTDDPRAAELERRIVLSQYIMGAQEAGSLPAQETGLAANSWFGKFHMEMYWWHAAHWGLWGRADILEKSLSHLEQMMPPGREMAKREGCKGVKWSKMTDPSGVESPSGIGPILVWQQPHPIYLAELVWRASRGHPHPGPLPEGEGDRILERYKNIVFETADYMATFVDYDAERKQYVLGPAVGTADEKHTDYAHNLNPTMELGYWKWALETAQDWRERLGMPREEHWQDVIDHLAPLTVRNGVYPALESPIEEKPSRMATWLLGILPGRGVDREAMRKTLHAVARGDGDQTWGTAMVAMCAARMGEPELAVNLLVGDYEKTSFRPSGYTIRRPEQTPMYMPANGGWLAAAAMMAAGWDGCEERAPGFPKNWKVRYEGLERMP
jgi:protein-glucosylgalactosylhydroxylysine glucosidase